MSSPSPLSPDAVKAAVLKALTNAPDVPEGHRGALLTVVNADKVEVVMATKVRDHWTVDVIASHAWRGDNEIGVVSKVTW